MNDTEPGQVVNKKVLISYEKLRKLNGDKDLEPVELLIAFEKRAKEELWTDAEILSVLLAATQGDGEHLNKVLALHSEVCGR